MPEPIQFPVMSIEALEDFSAEVDLALTLYITDSLEKGMPLYQVVGILQNQIQYLLTPEEDEE